MNIIEAVKKILTDYPKISEFAGDVLIDTVNESPQAYGISPVGDQILKQDVLGNQTRKHSFVLYAFSQSA